MALTSQQMATLKAYIAADPTLADLAAQNAVGPIAAALNAEASPAFVIWRTSVTDREIMLNGFDWARVDNLSVGKARIWDWLFRFGSIDPSKANVRAGIDSTWVGTAADLAVRAAVYVHCKRSASVAEKLFSTGVGSDASPAVTDISGPVTDADVEGALRA